MSASRLIVALRAEFGVNKIIILSIAFNIWRTYDSAMWQFILSAAILCWTSNKRHWHGTDTSVRATNKTNYCKISAFDIEVYEIIGSFAVPHSIPAHTLFLSSAPFFCFAVLFSFRFRFPWRSKTHILKIFISVAAQYQMNAVRWGVWEMNYWQNRRRELCSSSSELYGAVECGEMSEWTQTVYVSFCYIKCIDDEAKRGNENDNIFLMIHFEIECQKMMCLSAPVCRSTRAAFQRLRHPLKVLYRLHRSVL